MLGHAPDVLHQLNRIAEDGSVDPLENIADPAARLIKRHGKCIVDVTASVRFRCDKIPGDLKRGTQFPNLIHCAHCHTGNSFSGYFPAFTRASSPLFTTGLSS